MSETPMRAAAVCHEDAAVCEAGHKEVTAGDMLDGDGRLALQEAGNVLHGGALQCSGDERVRTHTT